MFSNKNCSPPLWNSVVTRFANQFHFVIVLFPGARNTAADYLSRLEADPNYEIVMKIREDVQTLPKETIFSKRVF